MRFKTYELNIYVFRCLCRYRRNQQQTDPMPLISAAADPANNTGRPPPDPSVSCKFLI